MPDFLQRALQPKNAVLAFGAAIGAAALVSIWGGEMFPSPEDPSGNPETWETSELRHWLSKRQLLPADSATRNDLIERVKANMKPS